MIAVSFSPKSRQDILDIGDYIAKDSQDSARRFVGKLIEQCLRIGNAPLAYTPREDLAPGLRMAPIGRYVVFSGCWAKWAVPKGCSMARAICPPCSGKEPGKTLASRTSAGDENERGKVSVRRHLRQ